MDAGDWIDAMYAIVVEIPHEQLGRLRDSLTKAEAVIDPEAARATWGLTEDHRAMGGSLDSFDAAEGS